MFRDKTVQALLELAIKMESSHAEATESAGEGWANCRSLPWATSEHRSGFFQMARRKFHDNYERRRGIAEDGR